ncbi:MAG TPA: DNA recombination protein RmuC [Xanthomonadales bacterium]|nr:DNA recombination protein RmuC [Xanthomonadales bacterium]
MNQFLTELGIGTPALGLTVGLLIGLLFVVIFSWVASSAARRKAVEESGQSEQRINDSFERLAGRIFEERSEKLSQLNEKQLETVLKPLGVQLNDFRRTVAETHRDETAQNRVLQEKLKQLEQLNMRLHDDATNLTNALTRSAKSQGNWGEQQLEKLLELAGLEKGREFHTQVSVVSDSGQRVQPDLVLSLPEGKAIVMDSKVSLTAWLRYQSEEDEELRATHLKAHIQSIRQHIKTLGEKRYAEVPDLNALDFVLMFVPIESALIEALQTDADLPAFALENKVALLSPTNLLATLRTVGSVWAIHRQNTNAQEIAGRAGRLYDKFADFVTALQQIGDRLRQAQDSYETALTRLSSGSGNLLRQAEMLRELGARASKQVDPALTADEEIDDPVDQDDEGLRIVNSKTDPKS